MRHMGWSRAELHSIPQYVYEALVDMLNEEAHERRLEMDRAELRRMHRR